MDLKQWVLLHVNYRPINPIFKKHNEMPAITATPEELTFKRPPVLSLGEGGEQWESFCITLVKV